MKKKRYARIKFTHTKIIDDKKNLNDNLHLVVTQK